MEENDYAGGTAIVRSGESPEPDFGTPSRKRERVMGSLLQTMTKTLFTKLPPAVRRRLVRSRLHVNHDGAPDITFRLAADEHERERAHALVHDCYVRAGLMDPCPTGKRRTRYHDNPGTAVFVAVRDGELIATASMYADTRHGLPSDLLVPEALDALRAQGRKLVEIGNLATHPDHRRGSQVIPMHLNKALFRYAQLRLGVDDFINAVHPRHLIAYEDLLLFERLSDDVIDYEYVNGNPAVVSRLDLRTAGERMRETYGFRPLRSNLHYFFFVHEHANIPLPPAPVRPAAPQTPEREAAAATVRQARGALARAA